MPIRPHDDSVIMMSRLARRRVIPPSYKAGVSIPPVRNLRVARMWEEKGTFYLTLTWEEPEVNREWISHYRITVLDAESSLGVLGSFDRFRSPATINLALNRKTRLKIVVQTVLTTGDSSDPDQSPAVGAMTPSPSWKLVGGDISTAQTPAGFYVARNEQEIGYLAAQQSPSQGVELVLTDGTNITLKLDGSTGLTQTADLDIRKNTESTAGNLLGYLRIKVQGNDVKIPVYSP